LVIQFSSYQEFVKIVYITAYYTDS
jgi:hypothetical protein